MAVDAVLSLDRVAHLTEDEHVAIRALSLAVYPPDEWVDWPGHQLEWAAAEWCVRVWSDHDTLACYVGVVLRQALHNGQPVCIGGVGGVKTHAAARRCGYAALALRRAIEFFRDQPCIDFALLMCEQHLIRYYSWLGWQEFAGRLFVNQHGAAIEFNFNRVMVCSIRAAAPLVGTIDLLGPPW
jgi:GNAT superfamily N-acetyltransferase